MFGLILILGDFGASFRWRERRRSSKRECFRVSFEVVVVVAAAEQKVRRKGSLGNLWFEILVKSEKEQRERSMLVQLAIAKGKEQAGRKYG